MPHMKQYWVPLPTSVSQSAFVLSTSEVRLPQAVLTVLEIQRNAKCLISMPDEHTCTVALPPHLVLKHTKSHYSLNAARSSPVASPSKSRSRAGTPVGGRPSSDGDESCKTFTFDHCLWSVDESDESFAGQEKLYEVLGEEFLRHSLEGYNCCIFACCARSNENLTVDGQTGSGKTHSMV